MKIEFHPDFKFHPQFKAIWPKLKDMFGRIKFKPENYRQMMRRVRLVLLGIVLIVVVVAVLARRFHQITR